MVVTGGKMLATGSAVTHATFVAQNSAAHLEEGKAEDYALAFIADMDTPGQRLLCRPSYEARAQSPFDDPLALAANGTGEFRGNQTMLGEVVAWRNLAWAMTQAMATDVQPAPGGAVVPRTEYATAARMFATMATPRVKEIFELVLGGSPLMIASSYRDLRSEELAPIFERFYRASAGSGDERIKLFKLIWDTIGSEFGGRHELYERNYSGNHEQIRIDAFNFARNRGVVDDCVAAVDRCLADYDLDGWTDGPWTWEKGRPRPDPGS
jgi:4-hydroxyphenylacetate 3-monooxygenase